MMHCVFHRTTRNPTGKARAAAFTLVEMIVVIVIIVAVLGIGIPALSTMNAEARFISAERMINGVITRAHVRALSSRNLVAVRFVPGQWNFNSEADGTSPDGRQHVVSYRYIARSDDPNNQSKVLFTERFERTNDDESLVLPADVWVAPVEATTAKPNGALPLLLQGTLGRFEAQPSKFRDEFVGADDFLLIYDPQVGLRMGSTTPVELWAADMTKNPPRPKEASVFRYGYTGIVLYDRSHLVALGNDGSLVEAEDSRQVYLRESGRPYYAHRYGGGLVMGKQPDKE